MIVRIIPCLRTLSPRLKHAVVLGLILLFGAVLRFRHLNWARGYYFQPDESVFMVDYALRLPASLNPYEAGPYAYGGLPVYLYYFSARALSRITSDPIWMDKWHVTLVARTYAAAASTITIALIYTLWHRLGTARVGWISALALAVSPLSIQYAHYGVVDTLLTFWVVLTTLLSVEAWMRNHPAYWAVAGLALGLAVATKSSGLVWALVFVVAALGYWARTHHWRAGLHVLALGCIGALIGVLLGSPYYVLDWPAFRQATIAQSAKIVTGQTLPTWTWQFLKAMPFAFEVKHLGLWAIGLPLAVLGVLGIVWLWRRGLWPRERVEWLLVLVPPTAYFLMIGLWHSRFIRYLLPVLPYVCFCAAQPLRASLSSRVKVVRWGVIVLTVGALLYSAVLGMAVSNIYAGQDPRVAASEWMLENLPSGAAILHDPEPLITLPLGSTERFRIEILDLYGNRLRNINDGEWYVQALHDKEYIVIVSRRNYGAVYDLATLFPQAVCYYRSVFDGSIGYRLVARFSNYPHLGPFIWNTDAAEETFQVFDHPNVYIFERDRALSSEQILDVLEQCVSR